MSERIAKGEASTIASGEPVQIGPPSWSREMMPTLQATSSRTLTHRVQAGSPSASCHGFLLQVSSPGQIAPGGSSSLNTFVSPQPSYSVPAGPHLRLSSSTVVKWSVGARNFSVQANARASLPPPVNRPSKRISPP